MLRETGELPPSADVIVLGAGIAGHCAALAAAEQGASVMLLEKASQPGGSSAMAGIHSKVRGLPSIVGRKIAHQA